MRLTRSLPWLAGLILALVAATSGFAQTPAPAAAAVPAEAPQLRGTTVDGKSFDLASLRGLPRQDARDPRQRAGLAQPAF